MLNSKEIREVEQNVFAMTYILEYFSELWIEKGKDISIGWRDTLKDLRDPSGISSQTIKFLSFSVSDLIKLENKLIERAIMLLLGAKFQTASGATATKINQYLKIAMGTTYEIADKLGLSKNEATNVINEKIDLGMREYESMF